MDQKLLARYHIYQNIKNIKKIFFVASTYLVLVMKEIIAISNQKNENTIADQSLSSAIFHLKNKKIYSFLDRYQMKDNIVIQVLTYL